MTIRSFGDKSTESFFYSGNTGPGIGWLNLRKVARRKLDMIHYALSVSDLKSPPGNRLEVLKGKFKEFYSIRINQQWRIIFRWSPMGPVDVQITDYH